jgi:hypothetical protein
MKKITTTIIALVLTLNVFSQSYIYTDASLISMKLKEDSNYKDGSWEIKEGVIKVDRKNKEIELTTTSKSLNFTIDDIEIKGDFVLYHLIEKDGTLYDFHFSNSLVIFWWSESGIDFRWALKINKID